MGFRFRKSIRILPGVRLNVGNRSSSVSLGGRGLTFNVGKKGTRTTVGLPGTGLSHSTYKPYKNATPSSASAGNGIGGWLLLGFAVLVVIAAMS